MELITLIFTALGSIATQVVSWFGTVFGGVAELIYTPASGSNPAQLTLFGILLLIGLGIAVVWTVLRMIVGLIRRNPAS